MIIPFNGAEPIVIYYKSSSATIVSKATLKVTPAGTVKTSVEPIDCKLECAESGGQWAAIFDPEYFEVNQTYSIDWEGVDDTGASFTDIETGIQVQENTDFYSSFISFLRSSVLDDGQSCDYPVGQLLKAVKYSTSQINSIPPFTCWTPEQVPFSLLIDASKIYLYRAKAARMSLDTFNYSDIGKSFNYDIAPKLLALVSDLDRSYQDQVKSMKRNIRPHTLGLASRYARRTGASTRSRMYTSVLYRNYAR